MTCLLDCECFSLEGTGFELCCKTKQNKKTNEQTKNKRKKKKNKRERKCLIWKNYSHFCSHKYFFETILTLMFSIWEKYYTNGFTFEVYSHSAIIVIKYLFQGLVICSVAYQRTPRVQPVLLWVSWRYTMDRIWAWWGEWDKNSLWCSGYKWSGKDLQEPR